MNREDAWLLEQLPHGFACYLPRSPAPHTLPYLAFFDGVIVPHQLCQGIQESSESCHGSPSVKGYSGLMDGLGFRILPTVRRNYDPIILCGSAIDVLPLKVEGLKHKIQHVLQKLRGGETYLNVTVCRPSAIMGHIRGQENPREERWRELLE